MIASNVRARYSRVASNVRARYTCFALDFKLANVSFSNFLSNQSP
uniref:Uncharacterized protein n=1 Tax=Arundo donax TaxID=35708 RepID=A0A0A9A9Z5_ARUDO